MSNNTSGYAGKIKNTGVQTVQAVYPQGTPKGSKITKGDDLRTKKSGK